MSRTNRFFIYAPFALFLALALGLTVFWFVRAGEFSRRLDALNGRTPMPGVTLHFSSKKISGFPFRVDAVFRNFEADIQTPHGPSAWKTEDLALHRLLYGEDKTLFEAAGRQITSWTDKKGRRHAFAFGAGSMRASAEEDETGLERFDLVAVALSSPSLSADSLQFHVRRDPSADAIEVFVSGDNVRLRGFLGSSFGDVIERLAFAATAAPRSPLSAWLSGKAGWPNAMRTFQNSKGTLHVDDIELACSRLDASGKGTVALDAEARPEGILDFKIARFGKFLEAARASAPNTALEAAVQDRMARAGSDATGRVGIVVAATDGVVYAGERPVGMLAPVY